MWDVYKKYVTLWECNLMLEETEIDIYWNCEGSSYWKLERVVDQQKIIYWRTEGIYWEARTIKFEDIPEDDKECQNDRG